MHVAAGSDGGQIGELSGIGEMLVSADHGRGDHRQVEGLGDADGERRLTRQFP